MVVLRALALQRKTCPICSTSTPGWVNVAEQDIEAGSRAAEQGQLGS